MSSRVLARAAPSARPAARRSTRASSARDPHRGSLRHRLPLASSDLRRQEAPRRRRGSLRLGGLEGGEGAAFERPHHRGAPQSQRGSGGKAAIAAEVPVRRGRPFGSGEVQAVRGSHGEGEPPRGPRPRGRVRKPVPDDAHPGPPACVAAEIEREDCATEAAGFADAIRANSQGLSSEQIDSILEAVGELEEEEAPPF